MRFAMAVLFLASCGRDERVPDESPPSSRWQVVDGSRVDVDAVVAASARGARARGLVPVIYFSAPYTMASAELVALRDTPPMRGALRGTWVIEVDGATLETSGARGFWHAFRGVDADGRVTSAMLEPGTKNGPCADGDADACAAWVAPFVRSLR